MHEWTPRRRGSGEFIETPASERGSHQADYYIYHTAQPDLHGLIALRLPSEDVDQNGVSDVLQEENAFSGTVSGLLTWLSGAEGVRPLSCRLQRRSGPETGTFEIEFQNGANPQTWRGVWGLYSVQGTLTYVRGLAAQASLNLIVTPPGGTPSTYVGECVLKGLPEGAILLPNTLLRGPSGKTGFLQEVQLDRLGGTNRFVGTANLSLPTWFTLDPVPPPPGGGCPEFGFPHGAFGRFTLELVDRNDSDRNGVPDLIDTFQPLPVTPVIVKPPQSLLVRQGDPAAFQVTAQGELPLVYRWFHDQKLIADAQGPRLSWPRVTSTDSGLYQVVVANFSGSVTSNPVRLTVARPAPEPRIVTAPKSVSVDPGKLAAFTVVADGEPPFSYAWYWFRTSLPGNVPEWRTAAASVADIGEYSVVVSNPFGSVTSAPVSLNLTGYPPRPVILAVRPVVRGPEIDCQVKIGGKYRLDTTVDLLNWAPLNQFTAVTSVHTIKHNFASAPVGRYYRIVALP